MNSELVECHTLWVGDDLPPMAAGCLLSFRRAGHKVVLHAYGAPSGIPDGIELRDAEKTLSSSKIIRHRNGSVALFANWFRYRLLALSPGVCWIDADMYCLRPVAFASDHLYGWEDPKSVNNAILRIPSDSALLADLLATFERRVFLPPWLSWRKKLRYAKRALKTRQPLSAVLPWGSHGPRALTWFAGERKVLQFAYPEPVFYPVPLTLAEALCTADFDPDIHITRESRTIHLWNEALVRSGKATEKGSLVHRIEREGLGEVEPIPVTEPSKTHLPRPAGSRRRRTC